MNAFIITEKNRDFKWFCKDFCNFLEKIMQKRGLHVEQFRAIIEEHSEKGGTRMQIEGMQKLTLLDYPGKTAAILFAHGCDFRCPFCHNAGLVTRPMANAVSEDEILSYLYKRRGLLDGVVLTGGEPLCQDIHALLEGLKGHSVNIETNGSMDIEPYFKYDHVWFTVDYKSLSSDMANRMLPENFEKLRPQDVLKFVVGDEADLRQALGVYQLYRPKCAVYVGAVFGKIEPRRIVEFMKEHRLTDWHMQLQLHKIIWNPDDRGV